MNSGSWYWPDVSDLDGAKDATKYGMWCAILVATVTALLSVLSLFGFSIMHISWSALLDAAIFGVIAFGLSRHSRIAAVAGFALFLGEKIYTAYVVGSILGIGVLGIIILFGFFNGMRGAFAYQKLLAAMPPQAAPPSTVSGPV